MGEIVLLCGDLFGYRIGLFYNLITAIKGSHEGLHLWATSCPKDDILHVLLMGHGPSRQCNCGLWGNQDFLTDHLGENTACFSGFTSSK